MDGLTGYILGPEAQRPSLYYKRFILNGLILSFVLAMVFFAAMIQLLWIKLSGFGGGVAFGLLLMPIWLVALTLRGAAYTYITKDRLWYMFGQYHFDSWEDMKNWCYMTPGPMFDKALQMEDEDWWEPDIVNGGFVTEQDIKQKALES